MQRIKGVLTGVDHHQFYVMTEGENAFPVAPSIAHATTDRA